MVNDLITHRLIFNNHLILLI